MINTIVYTNKNFPIPSNRVFEKLLNLEEPLEGQTIKIKSIFNQEDKEPSMVIFFSEEDGIYRFKDFSSDQYGARQSYAPASHRTALAVRLGREAAGSAFAAEGGGGRRDP